MKKRFLPVCLASSLALLLPTQSTAVQSPEPFIELESMKMFCTVRTDLSQSDEQIVQEISSIFTTSWAVRLHPQASPELQTRFEHIIQMVANALGKNVGGFDPGVYPVAEPMVEKRPVESSYFYQASVNEELDLYASQPDIFVESNGTYYRSDEEEYLLAQGGSNQPSSIGGGFGESILMGGGGFPSGLANELPVELTVSFTAEDVFADLVLAPVEASLQPVIEEFVVRAKIAAKLSTLPKVSTQPVPLKKPQNFLGWLHVLVIKNWLKAEVITPLIAAFLLLFTPFGGEILTSNTPEFLRRRRRFSLASG